MVLCFFSKLNWENCGFRNWSIHCLGIGIVISYVTTVSKYWSDKLVCQTTISQKKKKLVCQTRGNLFLFIGVRRCTGVWPHLRNVKKFQTKNWVYISRYFVFTHRILWKRDIFYDLCKNQFLVLQNDFSWDILFVCYTSHKYVFFVKLCVWTYNVRMYNRIFCFEGFNFLKYIEKMNFP